MRKLFSLLLSIASTSPMIFIFVVNQGSMQFPSDYTICALVLSGVIAINCISISLFHFLSLDSIQGKLSNIELASHSFLPNYLGYFFVAVSIAKWHTFFLVYGLITLFVLLSQTMYYNPFLLILGYEFYHATSENGTKLFLITKRRIRKSHASEFSSIHRINDFTYIEIQG